MPKQHKDAFSHDYLTCLSCFLLVLFFCPCLWLVCLFMRISWIWKLELVCDLSVVSLRFCQIYDQFLLY
jgi:hypothetical protein